ncbi:MAG: hypothetical protein WC760_00320 [Bacteroidia bacterium]|jgi:hypothetical protein
MKSNHFIRKLSLFTLALAFVLGIVQFFQSQYAIAGITWLALIYFYLLSFVTGSITQSGLKKSNKTFINRTYGAIGIRFVFSLFPLLIYLLFSPVHELQFIVVYILLYFFYTSFEIYLLVVNLRPDLKK